MLGVERLGLVLGGRRVDDVVPPQVAAFGPSTSAPVRRTTRTCSIESALATASSTASFSDARLAAPELPVGGDDELGLGVIDAGAERGGGEAGEDHECSTPSRAQANIATMASGIIGR